MRSVAIVLLRDGEARAATAGDQIHSQRLGGVVRLAFLPPGHYLVSSTITAPVLILHGSDDPVTPAANAQLLAERIPGAELHIVHGGRHMFFIEFDGKVNRLVTAFLRQHPLSR